MKIIAFGGSNSKHSINKKLAVFAANQFENGEVEVLDLNDFAMPLFSVDLEKEIGQEPKAIAFLEKISKADILVVSMAENNGNYSAAFKNVFDWTSRIEKDVFQHKPMLLLATSPGPRGGATVLEIARNAFPRYGGEIKASFSLPSFNANFDAEKGEISNTELKTDLVNLINSNF
ncbi:NAD(P)H-dependent oxidoreductase [Flavobacterium sp. MC2016-06]|uniref:NADPH-dependent FMN reductase n=1 Tax=Flavobacterium sp. MC2016-06 TaxID=2676308 RepID=UPI0012BABD69|nr:NAD(P)H-dependent oxidoreductase [Flavobacterium sp. MC2016-06]MBU3859770.1 NAD(P)H-dependent oxidoreductase [Flavobacterium sp. MC2016-06]